MIKAEFYQALEGRMGYALSSEQQAIIEADQVKVQVLATAGSGKTTTMTAKIGYTVAVLGISGSKILALSYSKASALDFKNRFLELFEGKATKSVHFSTLHAFAFSLINRGYRDKNQSLMLVDDPKAPFNRYSFLANTYQKVAGQFATKEALDDLFNEFSYVKNALINLASYKPKNLGFLACYQAYEKEKKRLSLIDFDDMLGLAVQVLDEDPNLLSWVQNRFTHVFLDEAQDVNPVQVHLLERICSRAKQWVVIGDDDQSIYGFRAADPNFIIDFAKREGVYQRQLPINYRCPESIVGLARPFVERNKKRLDKPIQSVHAINLNQVISKNGTQRGEKLARPGKDNALQFSPYKSIVDALQIIDHTIEKWKDLDDLALLCRNQYSLVPILYYGHKKGWPMRLKDDALGFFNHWVVRDVFNFLQLFYSPFSAREWQNFMPRLRIYMAKDQQSLFNASIHQGQLALADRFFDVLSDSVPSKLTPLVRDLHTLYMNHQVTPQDPLALCHALMGKLGYKSMVVERANRGQYAAAMPLYIFDTTLYLIDEMLQIFEAKPDQTIDAFQKYRFLLGQWKAFEGTISHYKGNPHRGHMRAPIQLLTMHGSKGLEFDGVMLMDLTKDVLPTLEARQDQTILEEERRLFYVAITRCRRYLNLLYPIGAPSQFIGEISDVDASKKGKVIKEKMPIAPGQNGLNLELKPGQKVKHRSLGPALVKKIEGDVVTLEFEKGKTKLFSLYTLNELNLIESK